MERIINKDGASNTNFYEFILTGGEIAIPQYQRFYEWGQDLVSQFIDDVVNSIDKHNLFLGVVIYKKDADIMSIVDGQQRIVTFLIFFRALINCGLLSKEDSAAIIGYLNHVLASDKAVFSMNERERRYFFKKHILEGEKINDVDKQKVFLQNIIMAEQLLTDRLNKLSKSKISKIYSFMKNNVEIVYICLSKKADENEIFEAINAKKLSLSNADLLKNYFLSKCHQQGDLELAHATWDEMYRKLEEIDQVDKFFEVYYTMKYAETIKSEEEEEEEAEGKETGAQESKIIHQENKLYHKYKSQSEIKYSNDHMSILKDMQIASDKYISIVNSRGDTWGRDGDAYNINRSLNNIDYLRVITAYPLLLRVIKEINPPRKILLAFVEMCEACIFLKRIVLKELPQPIKDYFNRFNKLLIKNSTNKEVQNIIDKMYKDIVKIKGNKNSINMFNNNVFKNVHLKYVLCRILFSKLKMGVEKRTIKELLESSSWEHIMPKQYDDWQADIEKYISNDHKQLVKILPSEFNEVHALHRKAQIYHDYYIDKIGNASILAHGDNSKIKNKPFIIKAKEKYEVKRGRKVYYEKKAFYKDNETDNYLFKDVINKAQWSWREIDDRSCQLINDYFKSFENSAKGLLGK
jgi:uncharacterized protein with ParB-like and HNH nuclease domain